MSTLGRVKKEFALGADMTELALQQYALRQEARTIGGRRHPLVAWLALIGLIIPAAEVQIFVGGAKFTVGRMAISLLFLPAVAMLLAKGRRMQVADLLVLATASWIIGAALYTDGTAALSSAGAESLELLGGYLVARGFFWGPRALRSFLDALKVLAFVAIVFAMADSASERLIIHDTFASFTHITPIEDQYRMGMVRATSTFDHAILFGTFCAVVGAILLYSETNVMKRFLYVSLCLTGAFLSLSSSSLMAFAIVFFTYAYGHLMERYQWRWTACWTAFGAFLLCIVLVTNKPLGWVLSHLTLDPESGYFRLLEWEAAFVEISRSPWTGHAFFDFGTAELYSVDCVWLALALRFGLPVIAFLFWANVAAMWPTKDHHSNKAFDPDLDQMCTALSLVLIVFMFVGLTAHYWNYMWIFWGMCIGIRASLRESAISVGGRPVVQQVRSWQSQWSYEMAGIDRPGGLASSEGR